MKIIWSVVALFFIGYTSFAQNTYKLVPSNLKLGNYKADSISSALQGLKQGAVDLTTYLPKNYVRDGSKDYTSMIQKGLNDNAVVVFPNFPILINKNGLNVGSNKTLIFNVNSSLSLQPNKEGKYSILMVYNASNIKIFNPVLHGDRKHHLGNTGEWGTGLNIRGSNNISIYNPIINDCWGDGIIIAGIGTSPSINIKIFNPVLDNNRRNGLTIGSVDGLYVYNALVSNTNGTLPMSGIDIEPNGPGDIVNNIFIYNPVTFNNNKSGIQIGLSRLPSNKSKFVNISILNHLDHGSNIGMYIGGMKASYTPEILPLKGKLLVANSRWINNIQSFKWGQKYEFSPSVIVNNISVLKQTGNSKPQMMSNSMLDIKKKNRSRNNFSVN